MTRKEWGVFVTFYVMLATLVVADYFGNHWLFLASLASLVIIAVAILLYEAFRPRETATVIQLRK